MSGRLWSSWLSGFAWVAIATACVVDATRPAEPAWNKQPCAHCMMLLSDKHTAAQLTLASGEREYFDDVGCLVSWLEDAKLDAHASWVRSPDGTGWLSTDTAKFASGAITPMDFGFVAAQTGISFSELKTKIDRRRQERGVAR